MVIAQCVQQNIRESKVEAAVKAFGDVGKIVRDGARKLVEMLADMNQAEVDLVLQKIKDFKPDWAARIAACAQRGLLDAEHLYGVCRIATPAMIETATPDALKLISDPDYRHPFVKDDGKSIFVRSSDLDFRILGRVWDPLGGTISEKEQRSRLADRFGDAKRSADSELVKITEMVANMPRNGRRLETIRITYRKTDESEVSIIVAVKELDRYFAMRR